MRTLVALLAGLLFGGGPACVAAYLPLLGPAPLRFLPAPAVRVLPPPTAPVEVSAVAVPGVTNLDTPQAQDLTGTASNAVVSTAKSPGLFTTETNSLDNLFAPGPPRIANEPITPQTLLYYFHQKFGDSHDAGTGVVAPLMFIPPQRDPGPPSKAAYASP